MCKRILHYAILAALLVGVPLACCLLGEYASEGANRASYHEILEGVKNFPPRTEDFGLHTEKLWNYRCPFNWWAFVGLVVFTGWCLKPFVKRAWRAGRVALLRDHKLPPTRTPARFPWFGWLGVVILAVSWWLSWHRYDWFRPCQVHCSYFPLWTGFILVMNGLCVKRSGHSPLTDHFWPYLATFPASSLFWWFFEYLNRYVWNWYYLGIADLGAFEYSFYATICFASVLPGVCAVAAWLHTFPAFADEAYDGMARVNLRRPGWCVFLGAVSAIGLTGIVFFPSYAYPFLWISPLAVFILVQNLLKEPSVLDRLAKGNWAVFYRFALAALICGLCWETWNYYAVAKWVYAVPWVHRFQIWEMPLIGFGGYLPFGIECAAVTAWIYPKLVEDGSDS